MRGRSTASIVASPVLVGAVTVLIVIVGVFLAYNANNGLPFVPTYELKAQIPNGQKIVRGNEVRLGGFRVGVVSDIKPAVVTTNGKSRAVAVVDMKLEKDVMPLPKDTVIAGEFDPVLLGGREGGWRAKITRFETERRPSPGSEMLERVELEIWWNSGADRRKFNLEGFRTNILKTGELPPGVMQ